MTCPACENGIRHALQRIRTGAGVATRTRPVACDCEAGRWRTLLEGMECHTDTRRRCPNTPTMRLYLTGTAYRMNADDASPSSPWFRVPSPEEVYGPTEGARLRAVGLGQAPRTETPREARAPFVPRPVSPRWTEAMAIPDALSVERTDEMGLSA